MGICTKRWCRPTLQLFQKSTSANRIKSELISLFLSRCERHCRQHSESLYKNRGVFLQDVRADGSESPYQFMGVLQIRLDVPRQRSLVLSSWPAETVLDSYRLSKLWYKKHQKKIKNLPTFGSNINLQSIFLYETGYRSVNKDLETQVAVVTRNEELQEALETEYQRLFSRAKPVNRRSFRDNDRIVPAWVCATVVLFRYFF